MCRQLVEAAEWDLHGGWALRDRMEWSNRACGMAALRMILLAYDREAPSVTELLKLGVKHEALTDRAGSTPASPTWQAASRSPAARSPSGPGTSSALSPTPP
ncbi:hypothetical protein ACWGN9_26990 [Streptomyces sp. NPDC055775]